MILADSNFKNLSKYENCIESYLEKTSKILNQKTINLMKG